MKNTKEIHLYNVVVKLRMKTLRMFLWNVCNRVKTDATRSLPAIIIIAGGHNTVRGELARPPAARASGPRRRATRSARAVPTTQTITVKEY